MATLEQTTLTPDELVVLERWAKRLREHLGGRLNGRSPHTSTRLPGWPGGVRSARFTADVDRDEVVVEGRR